MAVIADQDEIFTGLSGHHEFLRGSSTDGAAVCVDGNSLQSTAFKNPPVGLVHGRVRLFQIRFAGMKGVGVLHDEFTASHQAEPRPNFIAEFGLDLIKVDRQLAVGLQKIAGQTGDHFFVGWSEPKLAALAILEVEHDPLACGVALPATTPLPEFGRLKLR